MDGQLSRSATRCRHAESIVFYFFASGCDQLVRPCRAEEAAGLASVVAQAASPRFQLATFEELDMCAPTVDRSLHADSEVRTLSKFLAEPLSRDPSAFAASAAFCPPRRQCRRRGVQPLYNFLERR